MMTAADFRAIAAALGSARDVDDATDRIAEHCTRSNPRFDKDTFLDAVDAARKVRA